MGEAVRAMTTEEKIMELERTCEKLKYALSRKEADIAELRGVIRGLKYGLRCNGISGAEVKEE